MRGFLYRNLLHIYQQDKMMNNKYEIESEVKV